MIELYILLVLIIIAALIAVENHNLISSVIALGAVGLGLCIIFLMIGAPELAITQIVIEVLALVVLIRATVSKTVPEIYKGREFLSYLATIVFIIVFLWFAFSAFQSLAPFGSPGMSLSNKYIGQALQKTGAQSVIAAILFNFRLIDLLGMAAAIFAAAVGVAAVMRAKGRKELNERDEIDD